MTKGSIVQLLEIQLFEDAVKNLDARRNLPGSEGYKTEKDPTTGLTVEEEVEQQAEQLYLKQSDGYTGFGIQVTESGCCVFSFKPDWPMREVFQADPV